MKPFRNILGLLILLFLLFACENQNDDQHQAARLRQQLTWETHQRKALQNYIDYVLNARYEANAFGTGKRRAWKIKDPVNSSILLDILKGNMRQDDLPQSLEIIDLESVLPAPPKAEEMPGSPIVAPLQNIIIEDNLIDSTLPGRPLDTTTTPPQGDPVGSISDLNGAPVARRVGVSRGLPTSEAPNVPPPTNARTVVPASASAGGSDRLYVASQQPVRFPLDEALLFNSGSASLSAAGERSIRAVAQQLRAHPDHLIMIEGHTDSKEVTNLGTIKDNWDLSVMRATTVVRALVRAGIPSQNLIASGRGQHYPVSSNATTAGRSANRRVEIVLTPWPNP